MMRDLSHDGRALLGQAGAALEATQGLLDRALSLLKAKSLDGDRVSPAKLDEHQLISYELSLCWAECTSAEFLLRHAERLVEEAPGAADFAGRLAALFCAEAVTSSLDRLRSRPGDYGLQEAEIAAISSGESAGFLASQLAAESIAALGDEVLAREGDLGADLLDENHTMMRDTFRRFADEVVAPLAEEVHRHDLDIPDEILEPLKDMGMFGLSIPENYGGLQEDGREDTLGMCVVTEELSRGSLGAAGSLITRPEILSRALLKGGTEEQKQHWLPQLAVGEPLCAVAVTEPNYGSDVAGVRLKATPVEGGWTLNGAERGEAVHFNIIHIHLAAPVPDILAADAVIHVLDKCLETGDLEEAQRLCNVAVLGRILERNALRFRFDDGRAVMGYGG